MVMTKVRYYDRASIFDRFLIVLLSLSCVFLVNLVARSSYAPCAESLRVIKQMRADLSSAQVSQIDMKAKEEAAAKEDDQVAKSFFSSRLEAGSSVSNKQGAPSVRASSDSQISKSVEQKLGMIQEPKIPINAKTKDKGDIIQTEAKERKEQQIQGAGDVKIPKVVSQTHAQKPKADGKEASALSSSTGSVWKNKYGVVHVLTTRFMQLQPDLIHLGKARIELFKTFTLRSMREQSTQEYLWIIFTDPGLDPVLLDAIVELVKVQKNILLVGMNVGFKDFREPGWMGAIETVFSGDIPMLKDYQEAAQNHVYVESRIDADDSMYQDFMLGVQKQAAKTLGVSAMKANYDLALLLKKPEFRILCPEHHLEWGYFNPWHKESTKGHLFGVTAPEFCITAGLTYVFQIGTKTDRIKIAHHQLDKTLPQCSKSMNKNCIDRIDAGKYKYVILRSRTPTSAGMAGVIPTAAVKNSKEWAGMQDEAWDRYIFKNFGVTPRSIWDLRKYLTDDMEHILEDALAGQCTRADFTCKKTSRDDLTNLLEEVKKHSGGGSKKSNSQTTDIASG